MENKKTLYLECYSGISGDMTVAALLDLGADIDVLMSGLKSLNVDGYKIEISRKEKNSIDTCDFHVILDEEIDTEFYGEEDESHHSHGYNHGHEHTHIRDHNIDHEHDHNHEHDHDHEYDHDHKHDYNHEHGHEHDHEHDHDHKHDCDHEHNHEHGHEHDHEHDHDHKHDCDHEHNHEHGHEHDHEHDHDHKHDCDHEHNHEHGHERDHEHDHGHKHDHDHTHKQIHVNHNKNQPELMTHSTIRTHIRYGHHEHRNLYDINTIIEQSEISEKAKETAKHIFHIVAVAESKAHGKSVEEVHFHEVGAVDSIVDIVAAAICLDNLGIEEVIVSELYEGTGQIRCQHGLLPIPVPAVINISTAHQIPLHITSVKGELVTPTGAAIVAAIKTKDRLPKEFKTVKIGLGAGKRKYETAGILRAMLIEDLSNKNESNTIADTVWVLEANIDDCSGETLSIAMEKLFAGGARDAYYTPIFMKKNRPAYLLGVLCNDDKVEQMEEIIFTHTTTIGIRKYQATRTTLKREHRTIETPYGEVLVKVCTYQDKTFFYPECDSVRKLCEQSGQDYMTLYSLVQTLATQKR